MSYEEVFIKSKARLFVNDDLKKAGEGIPLGPAQSHYLAKVMRVQPGDPILLFNGRDGEWLAKVDVAAKRDVYLRLEAQTRPQIPPRDLWLLPALIKKTAWEWMLEKATELGVAEICPMITDHTVPDRMKRDRAQIILQEAAEQSEKLFVPQIREPQKLNLFLKNWADKNLKNPHRKIFWAHEGPARSSGASQTARDVFAAHRDMPAALLVGPEGGFSADERDFLTAHPDVIPVVLGRDILRAETANLVMITLWQAAQS